MSEMEEEKVDYIARFGSHFVSRADLLTELKYRSSWYLIRCALERKMIEELFGQHQIDLSEDEVYEFMDSFREKNDLYSEEEIDSWLRERNMDDEEFFEFCRHEASLEILKTKLVSAESLEEAFAYRKLQMDEVELYHILVSNIDLAQEIYAQVKDGAGFFSMAKAYSIDAETKSICGYMGLIKRSDLRAEIAGSVFGAREGSVIGPFKGTNGYHLYLVDRFVPALFNEQIKALLTEEFFRMFMDAKLKTADLEYEESSRG